MLFDQITIVGVGLIGGSVGLAAKHRNLVGRVVGVGREPAKLQRAVELGAIDGFATDLARGVRGSGLIVVGTPVDRIAETILAAIPAADGGVIFTDAGSTKGKMHAAVKRSLRDGMAFIPAHPLAGAEKGGAEHARADLFEGRVTILTPEADEPDTDAIRRVDEFWRAFGARVVRMDADEHDRALATTSHLPHAVASAVAGITPSELLQLTAGGFRDVTRIAAGDPGLWAAIFAANRDAVLASIARFTVRLAEFRRLLEAGDAAGLTRWLSEGKQVRDALGT